MVTSIQQNIQSSQNPIIFSLSNQDQYKGLGILALPKNVVDARFTEVKQEVSSKWEKLTEELAFPKYAMDRDEKFIKEEYLKFNALRMNLHTDQEHIPHHSRNEFIVAQNLLAHHRYRQPNCITFEHSKADDSYNCSCLTINERKFFALEGPTEATLEYFYRLLANWDIGMLVCLTGESENSIPKCYPYWEGNTFEAHGEDFFAMPLEGQYEIPMKCWDQKKIPYLHIPEWKDHQALDIELLINQVNLARQRVHCDQIMAIHCSAGVGRTGTFLALVALLDDIDNQIKQGISPKDVQLSIPKLFLELNFYRRLLIAKEAQYLSLYKATDFYLKSLNNR